MKKILHPEQFCKRIHVSFERFRRHLIDIPEQPERFANRDVPPQLGPLAKNRPDPLSVLHPLLVGDKPVHPNFTTGRYQHAAKHFDRRRLARAVGPDIGDGLPFLDGQIDPLHRVFVAIALGKQMLDRPGQPRFFHRLPEYLPQAFRFNQTQVAIPSFWLPIPYYYKRKPAAFLP